MEPMQQLSPEAWNGLRSVGFALVAIRLPSSIREMTARRNWPELDQAIQLETLSGGVIFEELRKYMRFSEIEFIISIRSSLQEPDEDGIWHDDGSRVLAFSLSLTLDPQWIEGGKLEFRKMGVPSEAINSVPTPPFGTLIVFSTGHHGFEHRINRVTRGERIVAAGWCT